MEIYYVLENGIEIDQDLEWSWEWIESDELIWWKTNW